LGWRYRIVPNSSFQNVHYTHTHTHTHSDSIKIFVHLSFVQRGLCNIYLISTCVANVWVSSVADYYFPNRWNSLNNFWGPYYHIPIHVAVDDRRNINKIASNLRTFFPPFVCNIVNSTIIKCGDFGALRSVSIRRASRVFDSANGPHPYVCYQRVRRVSRKKTV